MTATASAPQNVFSPDSPQAVEPLLKAGKAAFSQMACLSTEQKNQALEAMAKALEANHATLLEANKQDIAEHEATLEKALLNRLKLDEGKLTQLVQGIRDVARLPDPVGKTLQSTELDEHLVLEKRAVPLGLIAIIFESRPDVLPQIVSLILKSGNAVIFKGGREATRTNRAFMKLIAEVTAQFAYLPEGWVTLVEGRPAVQALLEFPQYVDLVIPRGSNTLVQSIMNATRIPVLGHADGVCHVYVHPTANMTKALPVIIDSKIQYPSACNALETLLVDETIAAELLPQLEQEARANGIALKADEKAIAHLASAEPATEEDWRTEYGNLTLAVKVVPSLEAAIEHINTYGSHHTDCILAEDKAAQTRFCGLVDSASVFVNASTRFADGFRYGFGAEIGISTSRTHARGPVGLEGLVSYKYVLEGQHQQVRDYVGASPKRKFTHKAL